jgi:hypothetical protein
VEKITPAMVARRLKANNLRSGCSTLQKIKQSESTRLAFWASFGSQEDNDSETTPTNFQGIVTATKTPWFGTKTIPTFNFKTTMRKY